MCFSRRFDPVRRHPRESCTLLNCKTQKTACMHMALFRIAATIFSARRAAIARPCLLLIALLGPLCKRIALKELSVFEVKPGKGAQNFHRHAKTSRHLIVFPMLPL